MSAFRRRLLILNSMGKAWDIEWKSGESIPDGISTSDLILNSDGELTLGNSAKGYMRCNINLYSNCRFEVDVNILSNTNSAFLQLELLSAANKGGKIYFDAGGNIKAGGTSSTKPYSIGAHTIKGELEDGYITYWVDGEMFGTFPVYSSQYLTVNGIFLQKTATSTNSPTSIKSFKYKKL